MLCAARVLSRVETWLNKINSCILKKKEKSREGKLSNVQVNGISKKESPQFILAHGSHKSPLDKPTTTRTW